MKLTKGFTLAEVLVTLGIIGVLSALVLPSLMHSVPNKEMIMYKKAFYLLSRNVNELINDEDFYPDNPNINIIGLANVNIANQTADGREATYHGVQYSGTTKFCGLMGARMNTKQKPTCNINCNGSSTFSFRTVDGITWCIPPTNFSSGQVTVDIDINGPEHGRNCYSNVASCTIPDRFKMIVHSDGHVEPPSASNGYIESAYLERTKTNLSYAEVRSGKK